MSKTLEKGFFILSLFTYERPVWTLDELAQQTDIPKPTLVRFLKTFTDNGFLRRPYHMVGATFTQGDQYFLGPKLIELGSVALNSLDVRKVALPYMRQLRDQFRLAVQLIQVEGYEGLYLEKEESQTPVLLYTKIGRRAPIYAGACARVLLAFQPEPYIQEVLQLKKKNYASGTITDAKQLREVIMETRKRGYSYSDSELEEGTVSLAVPLFNEQHRVQYAISLAGIHATLPKDRIEEIAQHMWAAAAEISKQLGYTAPYPYGR